VANAQLPDEHKHRRDKGEWATRRSESQRRAKSHTVEPRGPEEPATERTATYSTSTTKPGLAYVVQLLTVVLLQTDRGGDARSVVQAEMRCDVRTRLGDEGGWGGDEETSARNLERHWKATMERLLCHACIPCIPCIPVVFMSVKQSKT